MAEKKKMSVADILAAARKVDGKGQSTPASEEPSPQPAAEAATAEATVPAEAAESATAGPVAAEAPAKPAAKPKPAAGGARPSVADILKAAREAKAGAAQPAAAPAPKAAAKPAAAAVAPKPAAKPATAKPAAAKVDGAKDTASILAAARKEHKPGPMTKAEAAAKLKPEPEAKPKAAKPVLPPMPSKPDYAKPKAKESAAVAEDRRSFMAFAVGSFLGAGFTSLAATAGLWTLGTARFMFPNVLIEPPSKFKVGFPSDFAPGMVEEKFKAQFGIWVVKSEYQGQLQIYALRTVCTHLGCTPNWLEGEQKFKCPCHGSGFYKDGINFEGPAPRPLERYAIHMADDGQLEIDKSKMFQEEMGQWKDAASFVPA
ncbi:MAG TPA: Rieske (2Fe-2S) protein [Pirellulales bacterium]|jgi:cytochrome b6-f complex iron-sulfur subunit|nr:Rieske (2Fe-2S) protein [Pirellulales bacterium]